MKEKQTESSYIMLNYLLSTNLTKKADNQLSIHGLSFTEYMIMHHLNNAPSNTMRRIDLAECVGITASGVTRLLAPMEKIGLLQKEQNPRDARVSLVKLNETGQTLYQDASISFDEFAKSKLSALSKNQLENLTDLSNKIL